MSKRGNDETPASPKRVPVDRILPASLDPDAVKVIRRLRAHGHDAYLVGGCVRDLSLGRIPKDFDVATSARPRQVKRLFRNSRIIGRRFKLVHVLFGDKAIEVSTFRRNPRADADESSEDSATPDASDHSEGTGEGQGPDGSDAQRDLLIRRDNVFGTAEEDAVRRDFTINGLFYDVSEGVVIDYVGGVQDLQDGVVRTIGDPEIRFQEDPVRILRAIRFAARLGFRIEENTWRSMLRHQSEIAKCAPPRVAEELFRLLACGAARKTWRLLVETGVLGTVLPEIASFLESDAEVPDWKTPPREQLVGYFEALDRIDGGRRIVSNALLLTVLFCGPLRAEMARERCTLSEAVEKVLRPVAQRMSLPRRDTYRLQQVLLAQPKLRDRSTGKRRRRVRPRELVRREYFRDALDFLHVETLALGLPREPVRRWTETYYEVLRETDPEAFEQARRLAPFDEESAHVPDSDAGAEANERESEQRDRACPDDVVRGRRKRRRRSVAGEGGEETRSAPQEQPASDGEAPDATRRRGRSRSSGVRKKDDDKQTAADRCEEGGGKRSGGDRAKESKRDAGRPRVRAEKKGRRSTGSARRGATGAPEPSRLDFDEVRAGPLHPDGVAQISEEEADEDAEFDPTAPIEEIGDPGPISVIETGVDRTESKSRRRRRKKDPAARELSKEVEDQPGLQALKMTEGDPRGHEVTRPRRKPLHERLEEERRKQRPPKERPFDPLRDWESVEDLYGW